MSDDCDVQLTPFPRVPGRPPLRFRTPHTGNIFGIAFVPQSNLTRFVTCAMDGAVMTHTLLARPDSFIDHYGLVVRKNEDTGHGHGHDHGHDDGGDPSHPHLDRVVTDPPPPPSVPHPPSHHARGQTPIVVAVNSRLLGHHHVDGNPVAAKEVAMFPGDPRVVWSVGDDGCLRRFDLSRPTPRMDPTHPETGLRLGGWAWQTEYVALESDEEDEDEGGGGGGRGLATSSSTSSSSGEEDFVREEVTREGSSSSSGGGWLQEQRRQERRRRRQRQQRRRRQRRELRSNGGVNADGEEAGAGAGGRTRRRAGVTRRYVPQHVVELLSLSVHPQVPYILALGGGDAFVRVVDIRLLLFPDYDGDRARQTLSLPPPLPSHEDPLAPPGDLHPATLFTLSPNELHTGPQCTWRNRPTRGSCTAVRFDRKGRRLLVNFSHGGGTVAFDTTDLGAVKGRHDGDHDDTIPVVKENIHRGTKRTTSTTKSTQSNRNNPNPMKTTRTGRLRTWDDVLGPLTVGGRGALPPRSTPITTSAISTSSSAATMTAAKAISPSNPIFSPLSKVGGHDPHRFNPAYLPRVAHVASWSQILRTHRFHALSYVFRAVALEARANRGDVVEGLRDVREAIRLAPTKVLPRLVAAELWVHVGPCFDRALREMEIAAGLLRRQARTRTRVGSRGYGGGGGGRLGREGEGIGQGGEGLVSRGAEERERQLEQGEVAGGGKGERKHKRRQGPRGWFREGFDGEDPRVLKKNKADDQDQEPVNDVLFGVDDLSLEEYEWLVPIFHHAILTLMRRCLVRVMDDGWKGTKIGTHDGQSPRWEYPFTHPERLDQNHFRDGDRDAAGSGWGGSRGWSTDVGEADSNPNLNHDGHDHDRVGQDDEFDLLQRSGSEEEGTDRLTLRGDADTTGRAIDRPPGEGRPGGDLEGAAVTRQIIDRFQERMVTFTSDDDGENRQHSHDGWDTTTDTEADDVGARLGSTLAPISPDTEVSDSSESDSQSDSDDDDSEEGEADEDEDDEDDEDDDDEQQIFFPPFAWGRDGDVDPTPNLSDITLLGRVLQASASGEMGMNGIDIMVAMRHHFRQAMQRKESFSSYSSSLRSPVDAGVDAATLRSHLKRLCPWPVQRGYLSPVDEESKSIVVGWPGEDDLDHATNMDLVSRGRPTKRTGEEEEERKYDNEDDADEHYDVDINTSVVSSRESVIRTSPIRLLLAHILCNVTAPRRPTGSLYALQCARLDAERVWRRYHHPKKEADKVKDKNATTTTTTRPTHDQEMRWLLDDALVRLFSMDASLSDDESDEDGGAEGGREKVDESVCRDQLNHYQGDKSTNAIDREGVAEEDENDADVDFSVAPSSRNLHPSPRRWTLSRMLRANQGTQRQLARYMGSMNWQTDIKEACFLGPDDHIVAVASDTGFVALHDATTGFVHQLLKFPSRGRYDEEIVNCVAPHPVMSWLAVSGLEHEIAVWGNDLYLPPTAKVPSSFPGNQSTSLTTSLKRTLVHDEWGGVPQTLTTSKTETGGRSHPTHPSHLSHHHRRDEEDTNKEEDGQKDGGTRSPTTTTTIATMVRRSVAGRRYSLRRPEQAAYLLHNMYQRSTHGQYRYGRPLDAPHLSQDRSHRRQVGHRLGRRLSRAGFSTSPSSSDANSE